MALEMGAEDSERMEVSVLREARDHILRALWLDTESRGEEARVLKPWQRHRADTARWPRGASL